MSSNRWAKNKPLIIFELIVYGVILIKFWMWLVPVGFGHLH